MKKSLKTLLGVFALTLSVGAAVGAGISNSLSEAKSAEAWELDNWHYVGSNTSSWAFTNTGLFSYNEDLERYETEPLTMSTSDQFKIVRGSDWDHVSKEINCHDIDWQTKSVNWDEWGAYVGGTSGGNFQSTTSKTLVFWFYGSDMSTYTLPGHAIHIEEYDSTVYSATFTGGSAIPMTRVKPDEGFSKQFKLNNLNVTAGKTITFKQGSTTISSASPTAAGYNNIFIPNGKIIESVNGVSLFLKYDGTSWTYYLAGRAQPSYYIYVGDELHHMVHNPAEGEGHYMYTGLPLTADSSFKLYGDGLFAPSGYNFTQEEGLGFDSNGTQITCTITGVYNIYLDASSYNAKLHIGGQSTADIKATAMSNEFLDTFKASRGGMCNNDGSTGAAYDAALSSAWGDMEDFYAANVEGNTDAENILKNADPSAEGVYGEFAALYDKIYGDYAARLSLEDFAGRFPAPSGSISVLPTINGTDSNNTLIIVVTSLVALAIISAFFLLRKKKEN